MVREAVELAQKDRDARWMMRRGGATIGERRTQASRDRDARLRLEKTYFQRHRQVFTYDNGQLVTLVDPAIRLRRYGGHRLLAVKE